MKASLTHLARREDVPGVAAGLTSIQGILNQHTGTLDAIAKDTANWNAEMAVMRDRLKRHEDAFKAIAAQLGLDLTAFLH